MWLFNVKMKFFLSFNWANVNSFLVVHVLFYSRVSNRYLMHYFVHVDD